MAATEPLSSASPFDAARLESVFNNLFSATCATRLRGGAEEPLYQPAAVAGELHTLHYRQDFFASALHEIAHWCIAGDERRQLFDFGYWYAPEGRGLDQQKAFEAAERKPQALEWYFSKACAYRFQASIDNFALAEAELHQVDDFRQTLLLQALNWRKIGLPDRAAKFYLALCSEFGTVVPAHRQSFTLADLC